MRRRSTARPGAAIPADPVLVAGVGAAVAGAALLRTVHLGAGLPALVGADEPTVMDRAVTIARGGGGPEVFDWPPLAMYVLAGAMKVAGAVGDYVFGRRLFVVVALAVVALTGAAGAALADPATGRAGRRAVAWGGAGLVAASYMSVRLSRQVHPEHLQMALMLGSFLCTLAYDRARDWRWLAAAGALAGLAGAAKYLGVLVAVPAGLLVLRRPRHLGVLVLAGALGFAAGAPAALTHWGAFVDGLDFQFGHQAGGHLGYDGLSNSWWFHLTRSFPGNWGWPVTVLAVAATAWVLARGTRPQRLAAAVVIPVFAVVGVSRVRFPHYVLLIVPFLAPLAAVAAVRLAGLLRRGPAVAAAVALAALGAAAVPTVLDDLRLVRAAAALDTRVLATARVDRLPPGVPVWTERYAALGHPRTSPVAALGTTPGAAGCDCFALVSSYMEERYRREPDRYAAEVAVYDELRRAGRVVATIAPRRHLRYDWDLLPGWGLGKLPLTGRIGPVGPTITILDLRGPRPPPAVLPG